MPFFGVATTGDCPNDIAVGSRDKHMHLLQTKMQGLWGQNRVGEGRGGVVVAVRGECRSQAAQDGAGVGFISGTNFNFGDESSSIVDSTLFTRFFSACSRPEKSKIR